MLRSHFFELGFLKHEIFGNFFQIRIRRSQKFDFSLKIWYLILAKSYWQIGDGIKNIAD